MTEGYDSLTKNILDSMQGLEIPRCHHFLYNSQSIYCVLLKTHFNVWAFSHILILSANQLGYQDSMAQPKLNEHDVHKMIFQSVSTDVIFFRILGLQVFRIITDCVLLYCTLQWKAVFERDSSCSLQNIKDKYPMALKK